MFSQVYRTPRHVELPRAPSNLFKLLEVYIDDFIGMRHATRTMLHAIHSVFPPPASGIPEDDPISYKKLLAGDGIWAVGKEILGWIFDAILRTMELPPEKIEKIMESSLGLRAPLPRPKNHLRQLAGLC
jgi:hypothetical protein